jgi:hypothetical protein
MERPLREYVKKETWYSQLQPLGMDDSGHKKPAVVLKSSIETGCST